MKRFLLFILLPAAISAAAQNTDQYQYGLFEKNGQSLFYRILYPLHYDSSRAYPLIIFLHGTGQRGNDNGSQLIHGGEFFLRDSIRKKYPAIVLFPQCPKNGSWAYFQFKIDAAVKSVQLSFPFLDTPQTAEKLVKELADSLVAARRADSRRLYIGGLSMGGFGTFDLIARYPGYFAAAFPISGGGDTSLASRIAGQTAVWIFHGAADPLVSVNYSRYYFHALERYHADVKYTEYPGVKHNAWDNAFEEKELLGWLYSKKKNNKPGNSRNSF